MIAYAIEDVYPFDKEDDDAKVKVIAYLSYDEFKDLINSGSLLGEKLRNEKMEKWVNANVR